LEDDRDPTLPNSFHPSLEEMARRTAPNAERAFALLSRELVAPRGKVDLVIADNVDYTTATRRRFRPTAS
jgi:hypothetical protein